MRISVLQHGNFRNCGVASHHDVFCYDEETFEPAQDKTNKMTCAPSEDSDQPGHPASLIRVFAVRMKKFGSLTTH